MIALIVATAQASIVDAPIYEVAGQPNYLLAFRAHGSAEDLRRFKAVVDEAGWRNMTVDDAGEPAFLTIILKGVRKDVYEAMITRAQNGEFGVITFESVFLPVAGKKN